MDAMTARPNRRRSVALAAVVAATLLGTACGSGTPSEGTGPAVRSASASAASILPLHRGYLEIGTYGTEIFRPAFTIDIPVSSKWGTYGETGRKVTIGGQAGFFSFVALETGGSPPTATALASQVRAGPGAHVGPVTPTTFAGLPAQRVEVVMGPAPVTVDVGGQHLGLFRHEHAQVWLFQVGTAPVMVVLGAKVTTFRQFARDALVALKSVRFQAAP
jgi:hypothetical protein